MTRSWTVDSAGARIPVYESGSPTADATVVLIHGYPDDHHLFDPMIDAIGDRARVITYDTRGASACEVSDSDFGIERLAADLFAVTASIPGATGPVHVFAHDWGSVQAWEAMASPDAASTFASFVSVSGPSLDHLRTVSRSRAARPSRWLSVATQLTRSWYIWGFQIPVLRRYVPRLLVAAGPNDPAPAPTPANQARGIELYRANILRRMLAGPEPRCAVPTTVVVPLQDRFLAPDLTDGLQTWIDDLTIVSVDAKHWWPHSHPADAADLLMACVARSRAERVDPPTL